MPNELDARARIELFAAALGKSDWTSALLVAYNPTGSPEIGYDAGKAALLRDLRALAALPEREGLSEQQPVVLRDAHKRISGTVVSRMILNFYRAFEGTYGKDVMESNLCAVGPLQSMIGLAIINGQLAVAPAERGVEEPVAYIVHESTLDGADHWFCDGSNYAGKVEARLHGVRLTPLYATPPPPAGMVMVPLEPTEAMWNAFFKARDKTFPRQREAAHKAGRGWKGLPAVIWAAMIAAAPASGGGK